MITDHTSTNEQLKKLVADMPGLQPPIGLDAAHKARIDQLGALFGAAFEQQYKVEQVEGHRQAIARFESYAGTGDNADLKRWAEQTLPRLKEHLAQAEALPNPGPAPTTGSGGAKR